MNGYKKLRQNSIIPLADGEGVNLQDMVYGIFNYSGNSPPVRMGMKAISRQAGTDDSLYRYALRP